MDQDLKWEEFARVDMRVGTIIEASIFKEARNPAYKLVVDFGTLGHKKTSAQITKLYQPEELIGKQIIGIVNFPPKQIANFMSEFLLLGAVGDDKEVTILQTERAVVNGLKIS